ncbi:XdhC family protein [Thermosediminibacter litoriperuensis]|uniref:Xanthine dehydrogenase accessory factor n=1 Tax=Thermosediminibacter litoriperuensis TaxID=291989 RepID=A0A5S5AKL8_9FIRM|nr:XdhC/CoxI family protein [Thermosediminibacter litoriperuensis]TYP51593.1 xanthine dehydrogenase accessory factor [Thermosediminibacter litoriperuensis]
MNIFEEVLKAQKERKNFALVTVIKAEGSAPRHGSARMLVFPGGEIKGTIGGGILEATVIRESLDSLKTGRSKVVKYRLDKDKGGLPMVCGGEVELFIEVFRSKPQLVIAGAGHVGYWVSKIASTLDFEITVVDDREEWANRERFPEADRIMVVESFAEGIEKCNIDENSFVVIATRGHAHDRETLKAALSRNSRYIGMIGSRKKVIECFEQLKKEGVSQDLLDGVYAPVGLDLGAETPEEIAVSIMAEILMVKNSATGMPLSRKEKS